MGWYGSCSSAVTPAQFVKEEILPDLAESGEVIDWAMAGSDAYIALRLPDGTVMAVVYLIRRDAGEWVCKGLGESAGPVADRCPKRLLEKLTWPAPGAYAEGWRDRCAGRFKTPVRWQGRV